MGSTSIEWTDLSWNPGIYGCEEVSPACANCYAAGMAHRLTAMGRYPEGITRKRQRGGIGWTGKVVVADELRGLDSLPKRKPARVFVTSMSDLFHDEVPDAFIAKVFIAMAARPHLTFQVLTKRPSRAASWWHQWQEKWSTDVENAQGLWDTMARDGFTYGHDRPPTTRLTWPSNVWSGCTVEDQQRADERIPHLLRVPAPVRFLSMEPLLGPVDLEGWMHEVDCERHNGPGCTCQHPCPIGWVIAGGESGPRARPTNPAWFRSLRDQCEEAGVPFFFKQWGAWVGWEDCDNAPTGYHEDCAEDGGRASVEWQGRPIPERLHEVAGRTHHRGEISYFFGRDYDPKTLDGVAHKAFPEVPDAV